MIIWQITAGAQHNSFADTINIEPLKKKKKKEKGKREISKLFMKNTTLSMEGSWHLNYYHTVVVTSTGSALFTSSYYHGTCKQLISEDNS